MSAASVLIVEDNPDLGEALKAGIEEEGYQVTLVTSAERAIDLYRESDFDISFMDVKLPGIDGINGLTTILATNPDARIVVMSGYKVETLLEEAVKRGAVSVLQKPFSVEQMLDLIRAA